MQRKATSRANEESPLNAVADAHRRNSNAKGNDHHHVAEPAPDVVPVPKRPHRPFSKRSAGPHASVQPLREHLRRPLAVMKFGGTSVGDALRIRNVAGIVRDAAYPSDIVVVVSAMCGVTNKLIEATTEAESGNRARVAAIFDELQTRHVQTACELIPSAFDRNLILRKMRELFRETEALCDSAAAVRKVTPAQRDLIASLGERVCAPLVAAVLADLGVPSESISAVDLIVTDANHGGAEPMSAPTSVLCENRLRPLLAQYIVPIVTGYLGANAEGTLTTLGRGGSDYSATILGAALEADEVIIWTDVDGVLSCDPKLIPHARTIPEISYLEAADLAYFGAKVLHPKTLHPVMQSDIPVWIRNSFVPERTGTCITSLGVATIGEVKAVTAIGDARLVTVSGEIAGSVTDAHARTSRIVASVGAEPWLVSRSGSGHQICVGVGPAIADRIADALVEEFGEELAQGKFERVAVHSGISIVTVVGQGLSACADIAQRLAAALDRDEVDIIAAAVGSSGCNCSIAVDQKDMKAALLTLHREFNLDEPEPQPMASVY
ncbi:MAG TPA: aspartate kinase [Candidatus Sulfotelmatobacter sp.]|nr:aspartate kinase [Candidatus Sulfotelmatobacter sp.]